MGARVGAAWSLPGAPHTHTHITHTHTHTHAHYPSQNAYFQRARLELDKYGVDLRNFYAPQDHTFSECTGHKAKTFVQNMNRLFESGKDCIIDAVAMERVARGMAGKDDKFMPLVYPFHGTTDMQGEYALCYILVCPEYLDELLRQGLEREFCVLQALGMAWLAEDMHGLPQIERTRCIEMVRALLVYNICGDKLFLPYEGGDARAAAGEPHGVRSGHFGGFAAQSLLAFLTNAASRRYFRL